MPKNDHTECLHSVEFYYFAHFYKSYLVRNYHQTLLPVLVPTSNFIWTPLQTNLHKWQSCHRHHYVKPGEMMGHHGKVTVAYYRLTRSCRNCQAKCAQIKYSQDLSSLGAFPRLRAPSACHPSGKLLEQSQLNMPVPWFPSITV